MLVTAEELLAGSALVHELPLPSDVLHPTSEAPAGDAPAPGTLRLRPLTVKDAQLIAKAARDDEVLASILMIERAVVEPTLKREQISRMHGGLVRFIVDAINRISGLTTTEDDLDQMTDSPLVRAFFVLSREFGWTPEQVRQMTLGQILEYLELINRQKRES